MRWYLLNPGRLSRECYKIISIHLEPQSMGRTRAVLWYLLRYTSQPSQQPHRYLHRSRALYSAWYRSWDGQPFLAALWPSFQQPMCPNVNNFCQLAGNIQGGIQWTSHNWIIFSATPMASCSNGTGMNPATDSDRVNTAFTEAMVYSFFVISILELSDNLWLPKSVRAFACHESTCSPHWISAP